MQLVAEVERELQVLVGQRIGGIGASRAPQPVRVARERGEQRVRRAGRAGQGVTARFGATRWRRRNRAETCRRAGSRPPRRGARARRARVRVRPLAARPVAGRVAADPARRGAPVGRGACGGSIGPGGLGRAPQPDVAPMRRRRRPSRPTTASTSTRPPPPSSSGSRASAPSARRRIVEEREAGGPYRTVGDLVRVAGFGPEPRARTRQARVKV